MKTYLQPPATLNMGMPGSGKTDALTTWIEAGLELFVIVTESDGAASLIDACERRKLPIDRLHYSLCLPTSMDYEALEEMVRTIGSMGFDQIQNIKSGVGKSRTREPALKLLGQLKNFHCDRTGVDYGPLNKFDNTRAVALDSLSGTSLIAWMLTVGYKPAAHQGEWGVAQNFIEQLLHKLVNDRNYYFTLNAHLERETNELTGATQNMVSTLGRKLPPKIPRFFSEVILSKRSVKDGKANFTWSTYDMQADLKNRSLPLGADLLQSYIPIVKAYQRRVELTEAKPLASVEPVKIAAS